MNETKRQQPKPSSSSMINVGLTELHGIAKEVMRNPPNGVKYHAASPKNHFSNSFIRSPAKGVLNHFDCAEYDILEAPLFPIITKQPWVYTPAAFSGSTAFTILGAPIPRSLRLSFIKHILLKDNFLKLIFKSDAGRRTLQSYGNIKDARILAKTDVVYPCMRYVDDRYIRFNKDRCNFLICSDFFLKGGAHVVDAFEALQEDYSNIFLRICSPSDLKIHDAHLRNEYLHRIQSNPSIAFEYVDRETLLNDILPDTDVLVSPTYQEAFGFSLLEASAFGIPVISSNRFAIPEIIEHGVSGFLIETEQFDFIRHGHPCVLKGIPPAFHSYMSDQVYNFMKLLLDSPRLRREMGCAGLEIARGKFSFNKRNAKMKSIYADGLMAYKESKLERRQSSVCEDTLA